MAKSLSEKDKRRYNLTPGKQWGGKREGAGNPKWKSGAATPIRIPACLHETVLAYAHALDEGKRPGSQSLVDHQPMMRPNEQTDAESAEDIRRMRNTLLAISNTLEKWQRDIEEHNINSPQWEKVHQLFSEMEANLKIS